MTALKVLLFFGPLLAGMGLTLLVAAALLYVLIFKETE